MVLELFRKKTTFMVSGCMGSFPVEEEDMRSAGCVIHCTNG